MTRTVTATVTEPSGRAREGLLVHFAAPDGHDDVIARTDAGGTFRAELVPDIDYRVSVENAVIVDGVAFPAGTVLLVRISAGEGDVPGADALVGTVDASRPALLDAIDALTERIARLEASPLTDGARRAGTTLAELRGKVD